MVDFSPGVKRPVGEAAQSASFSADVKNETIYTSTAPYEFMLVLRKEQGAILPYL
jgi:hypothetical protein